jgi:A/G-specific adenine glycosylase
VTEPLSLDRPRRDRIREGLLGWFRRHARTLPWRETRDPYAILVSEVMLQQTQVDRVIPYYERFLERFPTVHDLAAAPVADVIRIWSGLGYNRRAVNLQRAAQAVVERFDGMFPDSVEELRTLPGVGAYTAGAVAAFAFERDVAFLDTNMRRVVTRLYLSGGTGPEPADEKAVQEAARLLVPEGKGWEWNQALIEFGALHCTARNPACVVCPLQQDCAAFPVIQSAIAARRTQPRAEAATPFESTSRYYRGRIVETLRSLPRDEQHGIPLPQLGAAIRADFSDDHMPWLQELINGLERDGLAMVAETAPPYDANGGDRPREPRVRLP